MRTIVAVIENSRFALERKNYATKASETDADLDEQISSRRSSVVEFTLDPLLTAADTAFVGKQKKL